MDSIQLIFIVGNDRHVTDESEWKLIVQQEIVSPQKFSSAENQMLVQEVQWNKQNIWSVVCKQKITLKYLVSNIFYLYNNKITFQSIS